VLRCIGVLAFGRSGGIRATMIWRRISAVVVGTVI
jgi:hypothetical protein